MQNVYIKKNKKKQNKKKERKEGKKREKKKKKKKKKKKGTNRAHQHVSTTIPWAIIQSTNVRANKNAIDLTKMNDSLFMHTVQHYHHSLQVQSDRRRLELWLLLRADVSASTIEVV